MPTPPPTPARHTFPRTLRVRTRGDYSAVFDPRVRAARGPLILFGVRNNKNVTRLGFSMSRKVGNAVRRNRIRRLLRESFRLLQHELPAGYDLVIVVRAHEPLALPEYQQLLKQLCAALHSTWQKKKPR
jgi:ribonuclease P protein component